MFLVHARRGNLPGEPDAGRRAGGRDVRKNAEKFNSLNMSCAVSVSFAPCRMSSWQPRLKGLWIEPGTANTLPAELAGQPRGDQRTAAARRLDHQGAEAQGGDDAFRCGKCLAPRRGAQREFADQCALAR